jgi:hypothetical protein
MAQSEQGESPRARGSRSRRLGEGQGHHREVGSEQGPIQPRGATHRNRIRGVGPPGTSTHVTAKSPRRSEGCRIHPASTRQTCWVLPGESCRLLVHHFARELGGKLGKSEAGLSRDGLPLARQHPGAGQRRRARPHPGRGRPADGGPFRPDRRAASAAGRHARPPSDARGAGGLGRPGDGPSAPRWSKRRATRRAPWRSSASPGRSCTPA